MKITSRRCFVASVLLAVGIPACREAKQTNPAVAEKVTVKMPWTISPEFAFLYCDSKNTSQNAAVSFEFEPSKGSHEVAQAFSLRKIDFGFLSGDSLIVARQKGTQMKALFALYQQSPAVVVSLKGSGIQKPKDLLGKKVGVIKASSTFPQFLGMMKNAQCPVITEGETKNITLDDAINGGVLQLKTHQIDALTSFANFAPVQLLAGGDEIEEPIRFMDHGIDVYGTVFAASDEIIKSNPSLVRRVTSIMLSRIREMAGDPALAAKQFLNKNEGVKPDSALVELSIKETIKLIQPSGNTSELGRMTSEGWLKTLATLVATGQAKDFDVTSCYQTGFAEEQEAAAK